MNQSMLVGGLEVVAAVRGQLSKLGAFIEMQFCLLGYREIGRLHLAEVLAEETGQKVALTAPCASRQPRAWRPSVCARNRS